MTVVSGMEMKTSNIQHPTSNEAPGTKHQFPRHNFVLELEVWNFSGVWSLELEIFYQCAARIEKRKTNHPCGTIRFFKFRFHFSFAASRGCVKGTVLSVCRGGVAGLAPA
jgi:hypothetical protein